MGVGVSHNPTNCVLMVPHQYNSGRGIRTKHNPSPTSQIPPHWGRVQTSNPTPPHPIIHNAVWRGCYTEWASLWLTHTFIFSRRSRVNRCTLNKDCSIIFERKVVSSGPTLTVRTQLCYEPHDTRSSFLLTLQSTLHTISFIKAVVYTTPKVNAFSEYPFC